MELEIKINELLVEKLLIFSGDVPKDIALKLATKHGLDEKTTLDIQHAIQQQIDNC